jgi:hypothetical protein
MKIQITVATIDGKEYTSDVHDAEFDMEVDRCRGIAANSESYLFRYTNGFGQASKFIFNPRNIAMIRVLKV